MAAPVQVYDNRKAQALSNSPGQNPLPHLLQLPSGLALLELQGTINLPDQIVQEDDGVPITGQTPIGRLVFPGYDPQDKSSTAWMKPVYMYVGKHQRLTGEVKKLPKAIAVIRKKARNPDEGNMDVDEPVGEPIEDLEIVEIVKHKIIFSSRPEPVGVYEGGD
jgi:chromosome transmission fidelity protein 8